MNRKRVGTGVRLTSFRRKEKKSSRSKGQNKLREGEGGRKGDS